MSVRKKLLIAITNRSSYNKVKTVLGNIPRHVETDLLLGGSLYLYQYGEVGKIIEKDFPDLRIWKVSMMVEGDTNVKMPMSVGVGIHGISTILENTRFDLVVTIADRFETLATATVASYTNVPLAHIQGGEISGTIDDKVRNAITQLADYHFPSTFEAADRIANMKMVDLNRIWAYGCPSMDLFSDHANYMQTGIYINNHGVGDIINLSRPFIIVMMHPDTTGDPVNEEHMGVLCEALNNFGCQKIIFWNNIDPGGSVIAKTWRMTQHNFWKDSCRYIRHVPPEVFSSLMKKCAMIIGNSSAGIREATFLGTPSISIGDRQNGREHGNNVIFIPFNYSDIIRSMNEMKKSKFLPSDMYGDGHAGEKIADKLGDIIHERLMG